MISGGVCTGLSSLSAGAELELEVILFVRGCVGVGEREGDVNSSRVIPIVSDILA